MYKTYLLIVLILASHIILLAETENDKESIVRLITVFNDDRADRKPMAQYTPPRSSTRSPYDVLALSVDVSEYSKYAARFPLAGVRIDSWVNDDYAGTFELLKGQNVKRLCVLDGMTDERFEQVLKLDSLTHLYLNARFISPSRLRNLKRLTGLVHLYIIIQDDQDVDFIKDMKTLRSIAIHQLKLSDKIVISMKKAPHIETVYLTGTTAGQNWTQIAQQKNVKDLIVYFVRINFDDIESIRNETHLRHLCLYSEYMCLADMSPIYDLHLECLEIGYIDEEVTEFCKNISKCESLKQLAIYSTSDAMSDEAIEHISKMKLNGLWCNGVNAKRLSGVMSIACLTDIELGCIGGGAPEILTDKHPRLQNVILCGEFSSEMLDAILYCAKNTRSLYIYGEMNIGQLRKYCEGASVQSLYLQCKGLGDEIAEVIPMLEELKVLHIGRGISLTSKFISECVFREKLCVAHLSVNKDVTYKDFASLLKRTSAFVYLINSRFTKVDYDDACVEFPERCYPNHYEVYMKYHHRARCKRIVELTMEIRYDISDGLSKDELSDKYESCETSAGMMKCIFWVVNWQTKYLVLLWSKSDAAILYAYYIDDRMKLMKAEVTEKQISELEKLSEKDLAEIDVNLPCYVPFIEFKRDDMNLDDLVIEP